MEDVKIDIPSEFGTKTGFREYSDGPKSGEEFFDELLKERFKEALEKGVNLSVYFDGGEGYTSSFTNEAFRRLGKEYGADVVWNRLIINSTEYPRLNSKVKKAVYENQ